ncbi:MAG TPA: ATP-binding protein, partial [Polyangiaceae bacterium]|nr:ATP-binding protein [Polyangiaceae bacterium]
REQRLAQLGEMSAVLAHEMRNPLASLKGHAQLLLEKLPPDTREAKKAERIVLEATRLESLSSTLLDFVRSGRVERQPTDVLTLIQRAAEQVGAERVHIVAPSTPLRPVPVDPMRMHQVLVNLLQNAIHVSPADRGIEVVTNQAARSFTLEVRDHGPGLSPGDEQKIFEAFHTTKTQGTGLGLAIARRIVELHDGRISARNHPEGGAVFVVELPL